MKTAMQELIEYIESNEIVYNKNLILKLKELLEKERKQIIDAFGTKKIEYIFNKVKGYESYNQTSHLITGEEYYNEKFNQNK